MKFKFVVLVRCDLTVLDEILAVDNRAEVVEYTLPCLSHGYMISAKQFPQNLKQLIRITILLIIPHYHLTSGAGVNSRYPTPSSVQATLYVEPENRQRHWLLTDLHSSPASDRPLLAECTPV